MRPLQLTFEGLNSFQERQHIDFELLTRNGLFGIFGPTGSGKSTVLDAITLALFGEVVRAARKTTGIMNVNANRLYVAFTFSLGSGERKRIYIVERQFVRKKGESNTVECRKCALKRLDGGDEPITLCGEKPTAMTAQVEELLGISMKDFIHSVVLPQGQFAEFLNMNGKDRRDMLERMFGLEEYGAQLTERVRAEEERCRALLDKVEAAMSEVGEASPYELQLLKAQRDMDHQELERLDGQSVLADMRLQNLRRDYQSQNEREEWLQRQQRHEQDRARIGELRLELEGARKSDMVVPLAERKQKLEAAISETNRTASDSRLALNQAEKLYAMANAVYRRASQTAGIDIEKYQSQIATLNTLLPRQREISGIIGGLGKLESTVNELSERVCNGEAELKDLEQRVQAGTDHSQEQQKIAANGCNVNLERLLRGSMLEEKMNELSEAQEGTARSLSTERALLAQAEEAERDAERALEAAQQLLNDTKQDYARAEQEHNDYIAHNAAVEIAKSLKEGQLCPVCGAVHHPQAARALSSFVDRRGDMAKAQVAAEQKLLDARLEKARAEQRCNNSKAQIATLTEQRNQQRRNMEQLLSNWRAIAAEMGSNELQSMYKKQLELDTQARAAQDTLNKSQAKLMVLRKQLSDTQTSLRGDSILLAESQSKLRLNRATMANWQQELADHGFADSIDIENEINVYKAKIEKLQTELHKSEQAQNDTQKQREYAGRHSVEAQAQLVTLNSQLKELMYELKEQLSQSGFTSIEESAQSHRAPERVAELEHIVSEDAQEEVRIRENLDRLNRQDSGIKITPAELDSSERELKRIDRERASLSESLGRIAGEIDRLSVSISRRYELGVELKKRRKELDLASELRTLLRAGALVEYVADQYMQDITRIAGERLMELSAQRYHLELDAENQFMVRDMAMNGVVRSCTTLSGGETFLVSLALALSLSLHIHLHGQPLGFFFLDEGFGTLDDKLLSSVISALNLLRREDFAIGVISHVPQLRERISSQLIISADENGSRARIELA